MGSHSSCWVGLRPPEISAGREAAGVHLSQGNNARYSFVASSEAFQSLEHSLWSHSAKSQTSLPLQPDGGNLLFLSTAQCGEDRPFLSPSSCTVKHAKVQNDAAVQVENPIPFAASSLTRGLSTGHLHARYAGLLLFPAQLSADWSFACIPLVESLGDPRNLLTAALYTVLFLVLLDCWPGSLTAFPAAVFPHARWRAMLALGLMVRTSSSNCSSPYAGSCNSCELGT